MEGQDRLKQLRLKAVLKSRREGRNYFPPRLGVKKRMNAESYELIFEGLREDSSRSREQLRHLLSGQSISQIFEIDSLLDGGPFLLMRSPNKKDLEGSYNELRKAGAQVLLVRVKPQPVPSTRRKPSLSLVKPNTQPVPEPAVPTPAPEPSISFCDFYKKYADSIHKILQAMSVAEVESLLNDMLAARDEKRNIFVFGNGGSASSASHMANDFSKQRFEDEKYLFRIMSLNDNVSCLTATANDFGYEYIFVNQLKTALRPGDLVVGISSSGNSPNITRAIEYANEKGAVTYGVVGFNGGTLKNCAQKCIYIPTKVGQYGYMEDVTLIINHMLSIYIYEQDRKAVDKNP